MDIILKYNRLLFCLLLLIWTIHSIEENESNDNNLISNINSWPQFYHLGESQPPTHKILNNLTKYREEWEKIKEEEGFGDTYSFTFSWDCAPCPSECLQANKFIIVEDNKITSLQVSNLNDDGKKAACNIDQDATNIDNYYTIDQLYDLTINWVISALSSSKHLQEYRIIELMLEKDYLFPMDVRLSNGSDYIAWEIPCFEPNKKVDEDEVCDYDSSTFDETGKPWTFWISKEMRSFLGWSMIFLILVACSLGYCINWLKKKKSEKIEAWREKEEKQREERERQKAEKKKKKGKSKRKGSKVKYKEKKRSKSNRDKSDINKNEYSSLQQNNADDDNSSDEDHYDIIEEQKDDE